MSGHGMKHVLGSMLVLLMFLTNTAGWASVIPETSRELMIEEQRNLTSAVLEYTDRIHGHRLERLNLRAEQEWLGVKIQRIRDQKRPVPDVLEQAVKRNGDRLIFLEKELNRLEPLHERRVGDMRRLDARVKKTYGSPVPEWWSWNPRVSPFIYAETKIQKTEPVVHAIRHEEVPHDVAYEIERREETARALSSDTVFLENLEKRIKEASIDPWLALASDGSDGKDIRLDVQLPILFGLGKADVAEDYRIFLHKLSSLLKPYHALVEVSGYPDGNTTDRKSFVSNMALGTRRAASVVKELMNSGLPASSFRIVSQGGNEGGSFDKKMTEGALSRRVEVQVYIHNPGKS